MKRTIVAIPLAATLLSAADEPKPAQNPTPTPSQAVQTQKSSAPAATHSPTPAPSQAVQMQKPLTPTAQKTIPARVRIGATPRGERNAFFVGADYQLGMMTSNEQACASPAQCNGARSETDTSISWGSMGSQSFRGALNSRSHVTNGFGIMVGYKHFFKKLPEVGLRYYGFFDYAGTDYRYFKTLNPNGDGDWAQSIYKPTNIFAYGVGTDFLFNPKRFNKENFHFGFFAGVAIGGTSWGPMNRYYQSLVENYGGHIRVSSFNFFFNGGIRFGTKHNGFEIGIKVPTIPTNYYTLNYYSSVQAGTPYRANLQRNFVFYWRYLVSF